jgi:hypothetical protein
MRLSLTKTGATIAVVAMLTIAGCSSSQTADQTPAEKAAGQYAEMNFDLDKCLPIEPNLYRCPATDKPLCTTEYSRPDIECVRVGQKGNVFVQRLDRF